jgi:ferrous iron transport protein A
MEQKLSALKSGDTATIKRFEEDTLFLKLMEMGCVPGEAITVEHIAPLGDPISISVAGYSLSLRINEADLIWVEKATTVLTNL